MISIMINTAHNYPIKEFRLVNELLSSVFYLHIDAYNEGMFSHTLLEDPPRRVTWGTIDACQGDGDILIHQEPQYPGAIQNRKHPLSDGSKN
jgi:hypothetical protein